MIREQKGTSIIERTQNYTCVDLETTGLSSTWNEIIEIGAAKVKNNTIIEKYTQLIKPEMPIPGIVTAITGITNEMVENAPTIETVLPQFLTWLGDDTILGHNVGFDINFLYDNAQQILNKPVTNNYIDTLRLARLTHPEEKHNRLQDLITRYNIAETQEHRALADVEQTIAVYNHILNYLDENNLPLPQVKPRRSSNPLNVHRYLHDMVDIGLEENPTPSPEFEGYTFVFTGALKLMTRQSAENAVLNHGGLIGKGVTKQTSYLVTGSTEFNASLRGKKSSKWVKAEKLKLDGQDIHIISEDVFYDMISESEE